MIKNMTIKKMSIATILLFICFLFVIFPSDDDSRVNIEESIEYSTNELTHEIYMIDKDNYVARTNVILEENDIEMKIRTLLEYLIIDGKKESGVPNGFRSIIPSGTEINSIELTEGLLKIDFSKEILEIDQSLENKMFESIIYTLTSIDEIKGIVIYVEGELLTVLPKSNTNLPKVLDRSYGINKEYNITSTEDITKTTIYYISKTQEDYYYVPVTKIDNNNEDKVDIIIDELKSGPIYEDNLMSFLNINTNLINYEIKDNTMYLKFDDNILDNLENKTILDEVVNTITYSVKDNYDVNDVIFQNFNDEIIKSVSKTLE